MAVHWAGVGPYFAERRSIDVLGRSDRSIAHLRVDRFVPGHSKWDWDHVLDRSPDIIDMESRGLASLPRSVPSAPDTSSRRRGSPLQGSPGPSRARSEAVLSRGR